VFSIARARSFSAVARASAMSWCTEARVSASAFSCCSAVARASAFKRSASSSWAWIARSRSTVALSSEGHAYFFSTKKSVMKTTHVQMNRPKFTSKGDTGAPWGAAAASIRMLSMRSLPASSDELEQQGEDEREDRGALEEHRDERGRAADVAGRLGLAGDRFRRRAADPAEADAGAHDREPDADAGAEQRVGVLRDELRARPDGFLHQHEHVQHVVVL